MSRRKNISIRFIAEKCGVSSATVSRALNNDRGVTEATRRRVLEAVSQYNYVSPPNRKNGIERIGVIIPEGFSHYYITLLGMVGNFFREIDVPTIAINTERKENYLPTALETMYRCDVSGVILIGCDYLSVKNHISRKIPHVWLDCNDPPEDTTEIYQVQSDQYVAGKLAAQEFVRTGCRTPIILCGAHDSHRNRDRLAGFTEEFEKTGLTLSPEQIQYLPEIKPMVTEGQDIIRYLVTKGQEFDSVFAMGDSRAVGAFMALNKMGRRIPEDVKLMGFDGVAQANISVLDITSIQQNVELLARNACETLVSLMNGQPVETKRMLVPTSVLSGKTM